MNTNPSFPRSFQDALSKRPFQPRFLLGGSHLQTVAASRWRRKFEWGWTESQEELLQLHDGTGIRIQSVWQNQPSPTLVALHGMGGSSDSTYMQAFSHKAYSQGWNSILFNLYDRNLDSYPPRIFHSGSSPRIGEAVRLLSRRDLVQSLFLVGVSMSGNILLKLLGEWASNPLDVVKAAAVISPLCDLTISWQPLEKWTNTPYRRHYVNGLKRILLQKKEYLTPYVDFQALMKVRTIREFDEHFTAPLGGFRDAFDYYEECSSAPLLKDIRVPTLILHSRDDLFLPWTPLDTTEARNNPNLLVHLTARGGHVGFIEQEELDIDRAWAENRVIDFFREAIAHL